MANVKFDGIGALYVTYEASLTAGTDEDKLVKISDNKTVALATDGDQFDGVVRHIESSIVTVQTKGFVTLSYDATGTAPTIGWCPLLTGAGAKVEKGVAGIDPFYRVVNVNTTAETVTFELR